ncbi:MlaA family lipoprotein [Agrilutibacter solisilvae]|uniref:VacJ family lipoprotein n=1 Tax=Agrilutibacter solisilvae TaxID=2763317 RepID=A0A974Y3N7_9GAMM|nr:MlaA family lipoprotein [Lysobacter solisilvae]QSX79950.1 VacJ family lipoprotein [Lysobacter solisilvae]
MPTDPLAPPAEGVAVDPAAPPMPPCESAATDPGAPDAGTTDPTATDPNAPGAPDATVPCATAVAPTQAEDDFADIYGYNPVADPNLPDPVAMPGAFDPWQKYNRQIHRFNNVVDRNVAKPLARGYVKIVPRPLRLGVNNFFSNISQPLTALNSLLQGKPKQAGQALGRFLINSTLGIGGIFDPARDAKLPHVSEDFGQTLGVWGWKRSRYVELPLFGPRTVRDMFGMVGDAPFSPLRGVESDLLRLPLQSMQLVDLRAQLLSTDSLREGAEDDYALVRDAWSQRRDYQIFGDRIEEGDAPLPDYLRDMEDEPTVPVDAMPVPVPGGGVN